MGKIQVSYEVVYHLQIESEYHEIHGMIDQWYDMFQG